jgi:integrase
LKIEIPNVMADTDRHGNLRIYYRKKGRQKIRLWQTPGTREFAEELEEAKLKAEAIKAAGDGRIIPGSLRAVCIDYYETVGFLHLGESTRRSRRGILEGICTSKVGKVERGDLPFARMEARHVEDIRDEKADFPEAANGRVKALRQLFKWAKRRRHCTGNPAAEVEYLDSDSDGFYTWTVEDVRRFEEVHPIGTRARLALAIHLYTGVRRSDAVRLGPSMERERFDDEGRRVEELHFTETKNSRRRVKRRSEGAKQRELPILPELRAIIDATKPTGLQTYLVTSFGKPFTGNGLGNKMRDWCDQAGLPQCSAHGLRKAGATIAAENGATEHQLMAIYGWDSPKQAATYTRKVRRKRLAAGAMHMVVPRDENIQRGPVSHRETAKVSHQEKK